MILRLILYLLALVLSINAFAQVPTPVPGDSIQLQRLINKSEIQIQALKEIISQGKKDSQSLKKAEELLGKMTKGIDSSIQEFQGTEVFEKALIKIQAQNNYASTYKDSEEVRALTGSQTETQDNELREFQKESVNANKVDLEYQEKLQDALKTASPGFISKIQAQAHIGNWRASTRLSTQVTEMLAALHAMREELRALRKKNQRSEAIQTLVQGSELQNKKQRDRRRH